MGCTFRVFINITIATTLPKGAVRSNSHPQQLCKYERDPFSMTSPARGSCFSVPALAPGSPSEYLVVFCCRFAFPSCLCTYSAQFSVACLLISVCKKTVLHKRQQDFVIRVANISPLLSFNFVYGVLCQTELLKFQVAKYINLCPDFWVSCLAYVPKPSKV